jgi:single-strand DNA-binding protein
MANLSKVQIIGNVGADPEQRYTQQGTMIVSFRVAVNSGRRMPDGSFRDETEWYRVSTFGRVAENCLQYVTKGSPIFVDGRLRVDRWTGQDGQPRFTLDVVASDVRFLGTRQRDEGYQRDEDYQPAAAPGRPPMDADQGGELEDLPF